LAKTNTVGFTSKELQRSACYLEVTKSMFKVRRNAKELVAEASDLLDNTSEYLLLSRPRFIYKKLEHGNNLYKKLQITCDVTQHNNTIIRRWDSERELSLRWHGTRTTKYNRLLHKFLHRSKRLCVGTQVYQIQRNNAM